MEIQATRDSGFLGFEKAYLNLRQKENRILTDEEVEKLPHVDFSNPLYSEWKSRQASCQRLKKYLTKKHSPLKILEVGCGNGWLSQQLSMIPGSIVTGADINAYELEQAQRVFHARSNLNFFYGDIGSAELKERRFDIIVFAACLQYFSSFTEIIKQAMELLLPNGEVHILDTHLYAEEEILAAKKRSDAYFAQSGYPELTAYYFHHRVRELENFSHRILYKPKRFAGLFQWKANPFYWVCITKTGD